MTLLFPDESYLVTRDVMDYEFSGPSGAARFRFRVPEDSLGLWYDVRAGWRALWAGRTHVPRTVHDLEDADGQRRFRIERQVGTSLSFALDVTDGLGARFGSAATSGGGLKAFPRIPMADAEGQPLGFVQHKPRRGLCSFDDTGAETARVTPDTVGDGRIKKQAWRLTFTDDVPEPSRVMIASVLVGTLVTG